VHKYLIFLSIWLLYVYIQKQKGHIVCYENQEKIR
jgi:hypothetical protein